MADLSKININGVDYDLKDVIGRQGYSAYYMSYEVEYPTESTVHMVSQTALSNSGNGVKVGDLLISSNSVLCKVTGVGSGMVNYEPIVKIAGGGNVDLSDYLKKTELEGAVNDALAQAKANGEFDGQPGYTPQKGVDYFDGDDYVLTDDDKTEIAQQTAELVEVPDSRCTPQMFGAIGNGITDDSDAMNNWFNYLAENNASGYIPNGTYLVNKGIGYRPSTASGKRISFVGESASQTIIKAGFDVGTVICFRNCYLGEFGNFTIDNNESAPIKEGVTGFQLIDMQYTEKVFSHIHDINIINIGQRAALIYNTANTSSVDPNKKSIEYVNMERVNVVSCTSDRTKWLDNNAPVGIIVVDTSHFHFINCTAKNINVYPLEFKNYTRYCSHENCVIENCGQGIYLGQQYVPADTVCHMYYKATGNTIKDVPIGVTAAKIAHSTFDNNTIIGLDGVDNACGFFFSAPCEYVTGYGNAYYGDKFAVDLRAADNSYCHDNVIETAIYKTTFGKPCSFQPYNKPTNSQRCTVIATNYQTIATAKSVDSDNNSFIPIVNVLSALT